MLSRVSAAVLSALTLRRFNGWAILFWVAMIPISIATGWISSVVYVSLLSEWALVSGHLGAWTAGRVEVIQDEDDDVSTAVREIRQLRAEVSSLTAVLQAAGIARDSDMIDP